MKNKGRSGYLPSLDGWRALSVLGVLLAHDLRNGGKVLSAVQSVGYMGVYVFFAISGFLLPTRMLEEERVTGRFNLKGFYVRRFFRIQPALFAYLGTIALLVGVGFLHDSWRYFLGAILSFRNFQFPVEHVIMDISNQWFTAHFWTLSIEEHFYILLSLLFLCARRARIYILGIGLAILITTQQVVLHHYGSANFGLKRSYWLIQLLFVPSLLALLLQKPAVRSWGERFLRPWVVFGATFLLLNISALVHHGGHNLQSLMAQGESVLFYSFGFWIAATVLHPKSWTTRALELKPMRYLGRISYSIYLWQQLLFWHEDPIHYITNKPFLWLSGVPQHYAVILVVATASYYLLEKPLVRLGHRLAPPSSPGHRDLATASDSSAAEATPA